MYRGVLWTSSSALRSSISAFRIPPCRPRPAVINHARYFSTPTQSPADRQVQYPHPHPPKEAATKAEPATAQPSSEPSEPLPPPAEASTSANAVQLDELKARVREITHDTLKGMRERGDQFTARVAKTFAKLGSELNRVTGYGEIELLKRKVVEQESRIYDAREAARQAKDAYDTAVLQRAKSQREVNDLLQRKSHWTDEDVSRFTTLVREDHGREHEEGRAKAAAAAAEDAVEREFSELMRVILNRYHEEQAWSDKIRSASTYGSLAALGLNMAVFILAIVLVEPWKRRRLAQTFERKVEEMSTRTAQVFEDQMGELRARLDEQAKVLGAVLELVHLANQVSVGEIAALEREREVGEEGREHEVPPHPYPGPRPEEGERIHEGPRSNQELLVAVTASAAVAGLLGWLARSWYG